MVGLSFRVGSLALDARRLRLFWRRWPSRHCDRPGRTVISRGSFRQLIEVQLEREAGDVRSNQDHALGA